MGGAQTVLKRAIKLFGSLGFLFGRWLWFHVCRLLGRKLPAQCVVLYYHAVPDGQSERFAQQMDEATRTALPISCGIEALPEGGGRYFGVTFDDGYDCTIRNALPELQKRNIPCTIFVVTDSLGRPPTWDSYSSSSDSSLREPLITEQVLQTLPSNLVVIGSHTRTHPMLTSLSEVEARRELLESRRKLEGLLDRQVQLFSFPYGGFNARIVEWSREAGYQRVFSTVPGMALACPGEYLTGRIPVELTDWPLELRLKLLGAYSWLPWAFSLKRRISGLGRNRTSKGTLERGHQ